MTEQSGHERADYTFGQVAIRENVCSFQQVKECLDIQAKLRAIGVEPKKLGEILIEKGFMTPEQAVQISRSQVQSSQRVTIPGYELISKIGAGAMGSVYKAKQVSMDRIVAIKVLAGKYSKDRGFVERFLREARAVARLNHENIISGIDVGETQGVHYFVMEFVDGQPAMSLLRKQGMIDEKRCLDIGIQIARALGHAHKHGIVHRDVKPENIMITTGGTAKLCDLGLAKQAKEDAGVTMDGMSVGTPNYISPEQARGEDTIDIRTDLYSLGASLYHMATGTTPFSGANPMVVMTKHVTEHAEPPKKRNPGLSEGFNNVVVKLMQKRREDRYQTPDDLVADIEKLQRGGAVGMAAPSSRPPTVRAMAGPKTDPGRGAVYTPSQRHLAARSSSGTGILIGAGVLVAVVVAVVFGMSGGSPPPGPAVPSAKAPPAAVPPPSAEISKPPENAADEISAFRRYVEKRVLDPAYPDRFTTPFAQIHQRIDQYKSQAKFKEQQAWEEELPAFTRKVNELITTRIWAEIEKKAREHYEASRYPRALDELARLDDVYKWFRRDPPEMTDAGKAHKALLDKINSEVSESFLSQKRMADVAFRDPKRRNETYSVLDTIAASGTGEQKADAEKSRRAYLDEEVKELLGDRPGPERYKAAQARLAELRALHKDNAEAAAYIDRRAGELGATAQQAALGASSAAGTVYVNEFLPKFSDALQRRDVPAARALLHSVLCGKENEAVRSAFLPAGTDEALLKSYLDPARGPFADLKKVVAAAEAAVQEAQKARQDVVKEFYLDLRTAALLEDVMDLAVKGAEQASKDSSRFKTGFSAALKDADKAEAAPRGPGKGIALSVTTGKSTIVAPLTPKEAGALTEDDIASLARRVAGNDPGLPVRLFLLYYFGGKLSSAKTWSEKLTTPESKLGFDRYAEKLRTVTSEREEAEARTAFKDAVDTYIRKKDEAGGKKKLQDVLAKYGQTEFMKAKGPAGGRPPAEIIQEILGGAAKPKGLGSRSPAEVFGTSTVRTAGNRTDITYTFRDDKEMQMWSSAPGLGGGSVSATRADGAGARLAGGGTWHCNVPFRGNVTLEVNFKMESKKPIGFTLCENGNQAGYTAFVDLALGQGPPMDCILRHPIGSRNFTEWILVQGGTGNIEVDSGGTYQARFDRTGSRLRFTLDRGQLETDHPQYTEGRVGVVLADTNVLIDRVRIIGEVDPVWLESQSK